MRIALYIGNSLYPNSPDVDSTIANLQSTQLTTPILSLLNQSGSDASKLVYNDSGNEVFDTNGNYIGDPTWAAKIAQLKSGGNIKEVYLSFSTNGCQYMMNLINENPGAAKNILKYIVQELGFDGIDLDYEGGYYGATSPIYPIAVLASQVGIKLTAAPYDNKDSWQAWVQFVLSQGGTVAWLNLQCYAGGKKNNPGDWNDIGVPIVAGSCNNCALPQTTCSPQDVEKLFTLWRTGTGKIDSGCWIGTPNSGPQNIGGGFIWVYSSVKNNFDAYINALAKGLGV